MRQIRLMARTAVLGVALLALSLTAANAGHAQEVPQEQPSLHGIWLATLPGSDGKVILGLAFRPDGKFLAVRLENGKHTTTLTGKYFYFNGRLSLMKVDETDPVSGETRHVDQDYFMSVKWIDDDHWTNGTLTFERQKKRE
jgi:hypothetical protein